MKNLNYILVSIITVAFIIGCGTYHDDYDVEKLEGIEAEANPHHVSLPDGIPDTLATGESIVDLWDGEYKRAYIEGRVLFLWNDDGTLRAIGKYD